jgi:hypothetical protein
MDSERTETLDRNDLDSEIERAVSRRDMALALLGAVGAASTLTAGCVAQVDPATEPTESSAFPVTADVNTYAALRSVATAGSGPTNLAHTVRGRAAPGDGGEGVFYWDGAFQPGLSGTGVPADDDGTYFLPGDRSASQPGRWRRVFSGVVNVLWYGADPSGATDSLPAFLKATKVTGTPAAPVAGWRGVGTIYIPRGEYSISPDGGPGLDKFYWWGRRWIGDAMHPDPSKGTVIRPFTSGTVLAVVPGSNFHIENIWFVGTRVVGATTHDVNIVMDVGSAHDGTLRNVNVTNSLQYSLRITGASDLLADHIGAGGSPTGILLVGCSASMLHLPKVVNCSGPGIEIVGGAATSAPTTTLAGTITIIGAHVEQCGLSGTSPLVLLRGVEGGFVHIAYAHNGAASTDALWVDEGTHNVRFVGPRHVSGGTSVLARIKNAKTCSFSDFAAAGENFGAGNNRIIVDSRFCQELDFFHCYRESRSATQPTGLIWDNTTGTTWAATSRNGRLQAASAPPAGFGIWQVGQVVENSAPAAGAPLGWVYTSTGWRAMPNLT